MGCSPSLSLAGGHGKGMRSVMETKARTVFYVLWCGSECAGNPHATREEAQAWIKRMIAESKRYGGFYGSYTIEERETKR